MLVQTKFEVCVGVRSGSKGPVIDLSIFGLESPSKQNLGFALGYILGRRALSLIFRSVEGLPVLGNMFKRSTAWRPQGLSKQTLKFALGYVLPKGPVMDLSIKAPKPVSTCRSC